MLIIADSGCTVTLAQLFAVHSVNHRQMRERRQLRTKCAIEQNLFWGVGDVIVAADHEIVNRRRVRAKNYEVVEILVWKSNSLVDEIVPFRFALGNSEANDERISAI